MPSVVTVITGTKMTGTAGYSPRTTADDATPGTSLPLECQYRTMGVRFSRPALDPVVTLCTTATAFAEVDVGAATGIMNLNGYMTQGNATSDPLYFITRQYAGQLITVFGSGNTLTSNVKAINDDFNFEARNNSGRGTTFIISSTPTSVWTTTST